MNLDLGKLNDKAEEIGDNIYGPIIQDFPDNSGDLCALNPEWKKNVNYPYSGIAASWIRELDNSGNEKAVSNLINIDGKNKIIKAIKIGSSRWSKYYRSDIFNMKKLRQTIRENKSLAASCVGITQLDFRYIGLDDFANELICTYIAQSLISAVKLPPLVNNVEKYVICGNYGLMLCDLAEFGDLADVAAGKTTTSDLYAVYSIPQPTGGYANLVSIEHNLAENVIFQALVFLDSVKSYIGMVHGDFRLSSILLSNESYSISYKGMNRNGNRLIKVKNFNLCSTSIVPNGNVRLFNEIRATRFVPGITSATDFGVSENKATNCIEVEIGKVKQTQPNQVLSGRCQVQNWWKLGTSFNSVVSLITGHSGLPYYRSYDFYVLIVSMMMTREWSNSILSSPRLSMLWNSMWLNEEVKKVTLECLKYHGSGKPSLDTIIDVLKKYHMSCSTLDIAMELYKL